MKIFNKFSVYIFKMVECVLQIVLGKSRGCSKVRKIDIISCENMIQICTDNKTLFSSTVFYVLGSILGLFFFDAWKDVKKYAGDIDTSEHPAALNQHLMYKFRAQRNLYIRLAFKPNAKTNPGKTTAITEYFQWIRSFPLDCYFSPCRSFGR